MGHVQQQPMAQRQQPDHRQGAGQQPAAHKQATAPQRPMLTPKLTTPSRALQKALSLVSRKLLKTCQGLYSPVVPSGSR